MDMILLFLVVFFTGYIFGWLGHARSLLVRLTENPDEMIRILNEYKLSKPEESKIVGLAREVEVEQVQGIFYLYAKDTGEFLAQSSSLDEALKLIEKRFPGQVFQGVISSEEAKRMGLSN